MKERIYNIIILKRKNIYLVIYIFFISFFAITEEKLRNLNYFSGNINLVILGSGNQRILNNLYYLEPSEVIVNGVTRASCKKSCEMNYEENNVTLYFNKPVNSTQFIFSQLDNIKEIDFSNFDFSSVTIMHEMFRNCSNLEKINFGNIDTSNVVSLVGMFFNCSSLTSIDLSKFNTKNVISLTNFMNQCSKLTSLDISNFDTSKVTSMYFSFAECINLEKLNLGKMNTSLVQNFRDVFSHCEKLESIDISSFNTSSATTTFHMFFHCYCLKKIEFPETFDTSNVITMDAMFSHCKSLTTLNLSRFDVSKVTIMIAMFNNCFNLKYLDISHFSPIKLNRIASMFHNMSSLIYLNIHSLEIHNETIKNDYVFATPSPYLKVCANQEQMKEYLSNQSQIKYNNCSDICFIKDIKLDFEKNECIYSCKDNGYNYELNNICYHQCPDDTHAIFKEEDDNNVSLCLIKNPEGYYLDEDGFYKKCYDKCKSCFGPGNEIDNNCSKCIDNYLFINDSIYKNKCYEKCPNYYYFNENKDYMCIENCSGIYDKFIFEKKKCIDKCENDDIYKYEYNKICYQKCPNGTNYSEVEGICLEEKIKEITFTISEASEIITSTEIIGTSDIFKTTENINNISRSIPNEKTTYISTNQNEKFVTTNNPFVNEFDKTIISNSLDDAIIEKEKNSISSHILEVLIISEEIENNVPSTFFNAIQILSQKSLSEYHNKTNFVLNRNNEEVYQEVKNNVLQKYDITKGEVMIFKGEDNFTFHITNSENELDILKGKTNNTNKFSVIDLGECENLLKNHYKIDKNATLIIIKFEKIINSSPERSIQYEVYEPYNKTKLNLSICNNITIDIYSSYIK